MEASEQVVAASSERLESVLKALLEQPEVHLVVKTGNAVAELRGRGAMRSSRQWITIEIDGGPSHVHVRCGGISGAEFVERPDGNCGVRFHGTDGREIVACFLPHTNPSRLQFSEANRRVFERLRADLESHAALPNGERE